MAEEEAYALACLGLWELLRAGATTVVDMYRHPGALARAADRLGLRAFVGGRIHDADMRAVAHGRWDHDRAVGRETLAETTDLLDRWTGRSPRIAPVLCPHAPDTCTRMLLAEVRALAETTGLPVHVHLAQSRAEVARVRDRDGRTPAELLDETGLLGSRTVAAHCIHLDESDVARVGRAGTAVAHVPVGNAAYGDVAPVRDLARAGARIALCTDAKSGDMFEAMRTALAVARMREAGLPVRAVDVLAWATTGGADALGVDAGRIVPGAPADLLVLDAWAPNLAPLVSPVGAVVHNGTGANVRHVFVAGEMLVRDGRPARADERALVRDAQAVAARMWAVAGLPLPTDVRWI
jgi:5-methylthioadenosine/S-adenosylhomocysteine deaminase